MNNNGIDDKHNEGTGTIAEKIRLGIFFILSVLLSNNSVAFDNETVSYMPIEGIEEFIVARPFRNSLGPTRRPGMRYFSDMGLRPTEISEGRIVFETESWYYCIELNGEM